MDNETKIIRLQTRQNRVVLEILDAEAQVEGTTNNASNAQRMPLVRSPRGRRLLRQWDDLDRQIRCCKHIEQLLSPIYFLAAVDDNDFISNDPITLFFWNQCKQDNNHLAFMRAETHNQ